MRNGRQNDGKDIYEGHTGIILLLKKTAFGKLTMDLLTDVINVFFDLY